MMEIVNTILIIIGFSFTGWYIHILQAKIASQKTLLENQSKFIADAKTLFDIYDIKKLTEFVNIREETISRQKDKEIEEVMDQLNKTSKNLESYRNEFEPLAVFSMEIISTSPTFFTEKALKQIPDETSIKKHLMKIYNVVEEEQKKYSENFKNFGIPPLSAVSNALGQGLLTGFNKK